MQPHTTPRPSPTRRQFLQATAAGAAGMGMPDLLLSQKTDRKYPIVGHAEHRYECIHDWGKLPKGHVYGGASHGVAIDSVGHVYVTHHGTPGSIFVFDSSGQFVKSMGREFMENGHGVGHGIDIRREGNDEFLYLSPDNNSFGFAKMSLKGELVWQKDRTTISKDSGLYTSENAKFRATNLSFSPDGGYYLGDGYGSGYIHRYDKHDKYEGSFGGSGESDGKFRTPHGQWLDERNGTPKVVVCDRLNKRLQYFDVKGKYLSKLEGFLSPADIDIRGHLMLVADLSCRLTILDRQNKVIAQLGEDAVWRKKVLDASLNMRSQRELWQPGRFVRPHDACFDQDGNIFVAEWVQTGRVSKLRKLS